MGSSECPSDGPSGGPTEARRDLDTMDEISALVTDAKEQLAKNPPICFHCLKRRADNLVAIVTDQEVFRGSVDYPRMVIVGICVVCEVLTNPDDLHMASQRVLSD